MPRIVANFFQDTGTSITRTLDWSDDLNESTISSVAWTVPTGLTSVSEVNTDTLTTIRMTATAPGEYTVICQITSAAAETPKAAVTVTVTS